MWSTDTCVCLFKLRSTAFCRNKSFITIQFFVCVQYDFVAWFPCALELGLICVFFIVLFEFIQKTSTQGNTGRNMGKWDRNRKGANYGWFSSQLPLEKRSESHFKILGNSKEFPAITPNIEHLGVCQSDSSPSMIGWEMLPKI